MSLGDLPPRQKMINVMYLVLLALLAMNVSKEILDSFIIINEGLEKTTETFDQKNEITMNRFAKYNVDNPAKVGPLYSKAQEIQKSSEELYDYMEEIKSLVIQATGVPAEIADTLQLKNVESKDNQEAGTIVLIGPEVATPKDGEHSAVDLRKKLEAFNAFADEVFAKNPEKGENVKLALPEKIMQHGEAMSWEAANFYHLPLAATITNISRFQAAVKNLEADLVAELMSSITADDFSFDTLVAKVIPHHGTYISQGDSFKADVIVSAYSTTQNPILEVGKDIDSANNVVNDSSAFSQYVTVENGIATFAMPTGGKPLGDFEWGGIIKIKKPNGDEQPFHFSHKFMIAQPSLVVSPTKMNVFYKGLDNPVNISVSGISSDKLSLSIPGCTVVPVNKATGEYNVKPSETVKAKEVKVTVTATTDAGTQSFEPIVYRLKNVPAPMASFLGKSGSFKMGLGQIKSGKFITASLPDFLFDLKFMVTSFTMQVSAGGKVTQYKSRNNQLTAPMKSTISKMKKGQTILIKDITYKMAGSNAPSKPMTGSLLAIEVQ